MNKTYLVSDKALHLDHQLCFALYCASLAMTRAYKPLLEPLGLTYSQYLVMLALWERDDMTVSQLGERLSLDSGTLTPLLKRLEAMGVVTRERDPNDERCVRLRLTAQGRKLKAQAQRIPGCVLEATQCSLGEVGLLIKRVRSLTRTLEASNDARALVA
jgi:MarR family transcriptional regulator, organic hydroperoxide resistance regulator